MKNEYQNMKIIGEFELYACEREELHERFLIPFFQKGMRMHFMNSDHQMLLEFPSMEIYHEFNNEAWGGDFYELYSRL